MSQETAKRDEQRAKWVYLFSEVSEAQQKCGSWDGVRGLLGGKGANLADMVRIGIPVPPGFVVTTEACNAFLKEGAQFPAGMWEEELAALHRVEELTGKRFGDPENPLLVSCRSGAKFSMPGMMDTVLNIGLNDEVAQSLVKLTGDERFVYDSYRRLLQMFGTVVLNLPDEPFEDVLLEAREAAGVDNDARLSVKDLKRITNEFKNVIEQLSGDRMPMDPMEQLRLATSAVFRSWNGKRAIDYRRASGIADDLGTAVCIVAMVFGNLGETSGTGVATTRNVSTGENELEGDFLVNAQGEDVVSGTRKTERIAALRTVMPTIYDEFADICGRLERHYRDVQDIEFTIERGKLWILQTRDAKRTAWAAVRIAVDLCDEGQIQSREAVLRISPAHIESFLHPQFDPKEKKARKAAGECIATGLNVAPGAAVGQIVFDADTAERLSKVEKKAVILVRSETKPDDVHGILAARGVLTSRGGRTSHAALVTRQFGKPAVVGAAALEIDAKNRLFSVSGRIFREGDFVSLDGTSGEVFAGQLPTVSPDIRDPHLLRLLGWADGFRRLGVWANADYPRDAKKAREHGAQGIGLCRTEHMFFEPERLPHIQAMILARTDEERAGPLAKLLPFQRADFEGLFRIMNGLPVTIRLIDPPLHEFLPSHDELLREVAILETREKLGDGEPEVLQRELSVKQRMLHAVQFLREQNPMLGLRGVRLGIHLPELTKMQVRAIFEAACTCQRDGVVVKPKIMIPLVALSSELQMERGILEEEAQRVMAEQGMRIEYQFGTMIEIPRASLTADQIAEYAEFFSFGTNDLTQTTFGISRDDAEASFLIEYLSHGLLPKNPFATLDERGVGKLMEIAVRLGRKTRPGLECGICGEHGGDPDSIALCHKLKLDYVSCSPYRVPVARLAAAHAALRENKASS
ncbi:MAG TPA: pyruvate, phosphate dikinase [Pseudomonadota bacterium]|nr:pyruvate, phosphate dikinase [Pseudomonadota bacterium]